MTKGRVFSVQWISAMAITPDVTGFRAGQEPFSTTELPQPATVNWGAPPQYLTLFYPRAPQTTTSEHATWLERLSTTEFSQWPENKRAPPNSSKCGALSRDSLPTEQPHQQLRPALEPIRKLCQPWSTAWGFQTAKPHLVPLKKTPSWNTTSDLAWEQSPACQLHVTSVTHHWPW